MNIKEATKAVLELTKFEKTLEEGCKDCPQCASTKLVKNEILNLLSWIVKEQAARIITLTTERLEADKDDPASKEALQRIKEKLLGLPGIVVAGTKKDKPN